MAAIEVPVFIDTNLGTHIAISVSPDLTVAEFKKKIESMHSNCHPEIGNIQVTGLMVKRKSNLYHLPHSMPIKHAFPRSTKTWFVYAEAYPLNKKNTSYVEPKSEKMCDSVSVSGVIRKYFAVYDDEVTSSELKQNYAPKTPPTMTNTRDQNRPRGVGKRIVVAANNLGISTSDKKPVISLCKYKCVNLSSSCVRHPVFEIGEG